MPSQEQFSSLTPYPFGPSKVVQKTTRVVKFLVFSITLGVAISFLVTQFFLYQSDFKSKISLELDATTHGLAYPLWTFDTKNIDSVIANTFPHPAISEIKVLDHMGTSLVDRKKPRSSIFNNRLTRRKVVFYGDQEVGAVEITFSNSYLFKNLSFWALAVAALCGGLFFFLTKRLNQAFHEHLVSPLLSLQNTIRAFQDNKWINPKDVLERNDEWGTLAIEISKMAGAIQERDRLLNQHLEELEALVQSRTRELDQERSKTFQSARLVSLGEMSAGIAHEINNPLAILSGKLSIMRNVLEATTLGSDSNLNEGAKSKLFEGIEKCLKMTDRIASIIKGLRIFSRDGQTDPLVNTPIREVISDTLDLCKMRLEKLEISLEVSPELMANENFFDIPCRKVQIAQVLLNLINNSKDAICEGSQSETPKWIKISALKSGHLDDSQVLKLAVIDSGNGIKPEIAQKMFDPFFTTKAPGSGTGLGLSISKGIIESHGGKIYVDHTHPNTCIVIELPLARAQKLAS